MAVGFIECVLIGLLLMFPLLWNSSSSLRYYIKMCLFNAWVLLCALLIIPVAAFQPKNVVNVSYMQWVWRKTLRLLGTTIETRDLENLKYDKPCVIVSNHQSSIDLIAMMEVMPPRTTALAKKELLYAGPFGLACWLSGIVFVDRSNHEKAQETMTRTAEIMHERQVNIWIYPEGTRNFNGALLPFKKGAFRLAIQAKVPIFPIVVSSYQDFLCKKRKIFNNGKVVVSCLPSISTEGMTLDDVNRLTEQTYKAMSTAYESISNEVHEEAVKNGRSIVNKASQ